MLQLVIGLIIGQRYYKYAELRNYRRALWSFVGFLIYFIFSCLAWVIIKDDNWSWTENRFYLIRKNDIAEVLVSIGIGMLFSMVILVLLKKTRVRMIRSLYRSGKRSDKSNRPGPDDHL